MPSVLVRYVRYVDLMNNWLGKVLRFSALAIIGILLVEIVSRYIFNAPTLWAIEMATFILGAYFFIGGGYVLLREGHIRMDILYHRWSPRTRAIVGVATFFLAVIYLVTFIWGGIIDASYSLTFNQHSGSNWAPALAPIKIILVIGAFVLLLQASSFFIKDLATIRRKKI
ncbi:TRAP transporter small permease subunit [Chloroflexota bacterium]